MVQALAHDLPEKPWDWVERLGWLVAVLMPVPTVWLGIKAITVSNPSAGATLRTSQTLVVDGGLASVQVPLVQPGGALAGTNALVVGRSHLLAELRMLVRPRWWRYRTGPRVVVLHGGGGNGKSTVAWQLASTLPDDMAVWWVSASSTEQLRSQLREVAAAAGATDAQLQLAWSGQRDPAELLWALLAGFRRRWLLVLDDANDLQVLAGRPGGVADGRGWLRPPTRRGLVVVTSRDGDPQQWGPWCRLVAVDRLSMDDAADLLHTLAPLAGTIRQARPLAARLDGLPLALRLAGTYLRQSTQSRLPHTATTFTEYLSAYQRAIENPDPASAGESTIAEIRRSNELSLQLLDLRGLQAARVVLQVLAQFAHVPIGKESLDPAIFAQHPYLSSLTGVGLQQLLDALQQLDLITQTYHAVQLHQHIQDVNRCSDLADPSWLVAASLIGTAIPADFELYDVARWPTVDWAVPHILDLFKRAANTPAAAPARSLAVAARKAVTCLYYRNITPAVDAERVLRDVLTVQRPTLGDDDRETQRTRGSLAVLLHDRGNVEAAQQEYRTVLYVQRKLFGDDDRETLRTRSNLALLEHEFGDLDTAQDEYQAVLDTRRRLFGDDDRETLSTRHNMAYLARQRGDLESAERGYRAVLDARRQLFGDDDRETLRTRHSHATLLHERKELFSAEQEYRAILDAQRRLFGDDDRETLRTRRNLALLLHERGELVAAEREYRAILDMRGRLFGDSDREVVWIQHQLAVLLSQR
ncbi:tetratricopeptide repeat protein [Dactylosporangium sp. NPDC005572]|uniref:tetratricopeptide repeat protein n=1 Tax=Dactylosporangium sp. NPDC005572 TaxID=3156889 RepID=UPI0033B3BA29